MAIKAGSDAVLSLFGVTELVIHFDRLNIGSRRRPGLGSYGAGSQIQRFFIKQIISPFSCLEGHAASNPHSLFPFVYFLFCSVSIPVQQRGRCLSGRNDHQINGEWEPGRFLRLFCRNPGQEKASLALDKVSALVGPAACLSGRADTSRSSAPSDSWCRPDKMADDPFYSLLLARPGELFGWSRPSGQQRPFWSIRANPWTYLAAGFFIWIDTMDFSGISVPDTLVHEGGGFSGHVPLCKPLAGSLSPGRG